MLAILKALLQLHVYWLKVHIGKQKMEELTEASEKRPKARRQRILVFKDSATYPQLSYYGQCRWPVVTHSDSLTFDGRTVVEHEALQHLKLIQQGSEQVWQKCSYRNCRLRWKTGTYRLHTHALMYPSACIPSHKKHKPTMDDTQALHTVRFKKRNCCTYSLWSGCGL